MTSKPVLVRFFLSLIAPLVFCFNHAIAALPEETAALLEKGTVQLKEGNYEEAVELFKKAREAAPASSIAAYDLGMAYKKAQDFREAKIHLRDAVTLRPAVKEAVVELADVLYQIGETEDALQEIEAAGREGVESPQAVFLRGMILAKLGRNPDAIDSFKRAKSMDAALAPSADYQIALATLQTGRLEDAREAFKEIVVRDPNSDLAQFANQYIEAITKKLGEEKPFTAAIGLQYQYDDNVILKPGNVTAAGDIANKESSAVLATLRAEYSPRLKGRYNVKTQYSLYLSRHNDLSRYDVQSHTLAVVPSYNLGQSQVSLLASYNDTLADNDNYLQVFTLSPTDTFTLGKKQFVQGSLKYQRSDYLKRPIQADEDRDGDGYGAGLSWFYLTAGGRGFVNARYDVNREATDGVNWRYLGHKAGLVVLYPFTDNVKFNAGAEAYDQKFEKTHTAFHRRREDMNYTVYGMLSHPLSGRIDLQGQYTHIRGDSNIAVYDFEKNIFSIGVEGRF